MKLYQLMATIWLLVSIASLLGSIGTVPVPIPLAVMVVAIALEVVVRVKGWDATKVLY